MSIFSFMLPFISVVPGCDSKPDGRSTLYYGYELLDGTTSADSSQHLTTLLVVPIGIAVLLFARTFLSHAATLSLEGFLQSWEAFLASASAALIAGVPSWAFLFATVFPEIGQYVGTASWAFLSLVGLIEALRLLARLRHAPAALGPPSGRRRWREPATVSPALLALTGPATIYLVSLGDPFEHVGIPWLATSASFLAVCLVIYFFIAGLRARERWTEVWSRVASLVVLLGGVLSGWILIKGSPFTVPSLAMVWLGATLFSGIVAIVVGHLPLREEAGRAARYFGFARSPYYRVMAIGTLALMLSTRIAQHRLWIGVAIPTYTVLLISGTFAFKAQQTLRTEAGVEEFRFSGSLGIVGVVVALAVTFPHLMMGTLAFWANIVASAVQAALFLPHAYVRSKRETLPAPGNFRQIALIMAVLLVGGAYSLSQYGVHLVKSIDAIEAIPAVSSRIQAMEEEHTSLEAAHAQMKGKNRSEDAAREIQIMGLEEEIVALRLQRDELESASRFSEEMSGRFLAIAISLYLPWLVAAAVGISGLKKIRQKNGQSPRPDPPPKGGGK